MALTYGFYNSMNHDRKYDAIQVSQIFDGIISDGVYATYRNHLFVRSSSQRSQVIIGSGRAWFDHTWSYNDADLPFDLPDAEPFLNRYDAVVLDVNTSSRTNSFQYVKGTPSESPDYPAIIKSPEHNQYPLCYILRSGGSSIIVQGNIENTIGTAACPFVTGVIDHVTVDELLEQWSAQFDEYVLAKQRQWNNFQYGMEVQITAYERNMESQFFAWMESLNGKYDEMLDHNSIAWNNWFSHIQTELDGDVAGNLQNQIDKIKKFAWIYVVDKVLYVPMSAASISDKKLTFVTV